MHTSIRILILTLITALSCQAVLAQHVYTGTIIDNKTRQPLEGACISAQRQVRCTDKEGHFRLNLQTDTATLTITYIGYTTGAIPAKSHMPLLIVMTPGQIDLNEVTIAQPLSYGSFHTLSTLDLSLRPANSSQDLMRLVPGLFIAQHMGGGKAEQIFIRGFDADHGTDLNVSVDGMPVNMVSHIHGQGYADLHFLIPETISEYDYGKGPYYTDHGDFTTAGYLSYSTKDAVDKSIIGLEGGRFNTYRGMALINLLNDTAKHENAYVAGEYNYTDGPFLLPEHYKRTNLFGKYTRQLGENNKLSLSLSSFSTSWIASGEIPERAAAAGTTAVDENGNPYIVAEAPSPINRFGTIDSAQGGKSTRINAIAKLTSDLKNSWMLENELYYTHYTFLLHVNSIFFAEDTLNGGERQQYQARDMFGYNGKLTKRTYFGNTTLTSTIGLQSRFDRTHGTEYTNVTEQYQLLDYIEQGDIRQNNSAIYLDETLESGKWAINIGSRLDYFHFNYHDTTKTQVLASPKINIQYQADNDLQFYLKAGKGFHSNNAIAVIGNNGIQTIPAAYGADLGLNWKPLPHLFINAAMWYLYSQQEFIYTDDGDIAPGGRTRREGLDLSGRYQIAKWLFADLNINLAHSRLVDSIKGKNYLALAPNLTSTGGLDFKFSNGINGGLSYRYMHERPGNNMNTLKADGYFVTDLKLNYTQKRYELGLSVENLLNTQWNEFEAEEVSRLRGESTPVDQMSFTPGTPFFVKLRVSLFF